jgi:hypothetical protein
MKDLTEKQMQAAVDAVVRCSANTEPWTGIRVLDTRLIEIQLAAAIPFLQLPWDMPTVSESKSVQEMCFGGPIGSITMANIAKIIGCFVESRNINLLPKAVDPAVAVVSKMLRDRSLDDSFDTYAEKLVQAVREAK